MRRVSGLSLATSLAATLLTVSPVGADEAGAIQGLRLDRATVAAGEGLGVDGTFAAAWQSTMDAWSDEAFLFTEVTSADPDMDLILGYIQHSRPGDPITFRAGLRGGGGAGEAKAGATLEWPFALGDDFYLLRMLRDLVSNAATYQWTGSLWRCADPSCEAPQEIGMVPVSFSAVGRDLIANVPLELLAGPGGSRGPQAFTHSSDNPPSSGYRAEVMDDAVTDQLVGATVPVDQAKTLRTGVIAVAAVRLGIAPDGVAADQVGYTSVAELSLAPSVMDVPFTAALSTEGLAPGEYRVWAEACFGGCTVSSVPLTITA